MDSSDEKLTLENVDERIEQCLSQSQGLSSSTTISLTRTVHNLQGIYEEDRRLEQVWTRINSQASALNSVHAIGQADGLAGRGQADAPTFDAGEEQLGLAGRGQADAPMFDGGEKRLQLPFRRGRYNLGIGLVAAVILIAFFVWPVVSYALRGAQIASPQPIVKTVTPQIQSTVNVPKQTGTATAVTPTIPPTATSAAMSSPTAIVSPTTNVSSIKVYNDLYFTIQYPADWGITSVTTGGTYLQTVQFRPSATSSVFASVNTMYSSTLSSDLLLLADTDVKKGILQSTSTITYHGIIWTVGIVEIAGSAQASASKLEIAYSNQGRPYRIEFGAPSAMFSTDAQVFDAMFASFYPVS